MNKFLQMLFETARDAGERAYAPYSDYKVGAALKSAGGGIYAGGNAELANYKGTCAEAGAIAAMITAGERQIEAIAIVGPGDDLCTPCGDCRQRIREFATAETRIHIFAKNGVLMKTYTMEELLPDSFGPANLSAGKISR